MRRPAVAVVVALALVAGGGAAWAWDAHPNPATAVTGGGATVTAAASGDGSGALAARGPLDAPVPAGATTSASSAQPTAGTASPGPTPVLTTPAAAAPAAGASTAPSCATTYHGPPFSTSVPGATGDVTKNGDIPASAMAPVSWTTDSRGAGYWLVKPATAALERLDVAFRARFGHDLDIDLAYRDLATQAAMYAALGPAVAAYPGTSKHGWGTAIDVPEWPCQYGLNTPQRDWLVAHGPTFGWHPIATEYWHFEYRP